MEAKQAEEEFTISLKEMDTFFKRRWRALRPKPGDGRGEINYDLSLSDFVLVRVWTTIGVGRERSAPKGTDAIRIQLLSKAGRPLLAGKSPIVKRTKGWMDNLQDRIEDMLELYEEKESYFEERAGAPPTQDERQEEERREQEARQPERQEPSGPLEGTFARLPSGDWGLRIRGDARPGDRVNTRRQDGEVKVLTVGEVVKREHGITYTTISRGGARYASCCGGTGVQPDGHPCQCGGGCGKAASDDYSYDRMV